jgi:hypothetical protein
MFEESRRQTEVDAEIKVALHELKDEIVNENKRTLKEELSGLEKRFSQTVDLRIAHVEEKADRALDQSRQHYETGLELQKKLADIELKTTKQIDKKLEPVNAALALLDVRQVKDETKEEVKDKIEEKAINKSNMHWGKVAGIAAIASVLSGLAVWVLT